MSAGHSSSFGRAVDPRLVFSADIKERRQLTLRNIDRKLQIATLVGVQTARRFTPNVWPRVVTLIRTSDALPLQVLDLARPERLLAAAPLVLRFAPDRCRCAAASNLAEDDQVVELGLSVCREFEPKRRAAGVG